MRKQKDRADTVSKRVVRKMAIKDSIGQKKSEEALRHSEERYRATMMSVGDGVIAADIKRIVTFMNPVAETLTGWRQEEARGKPLEKVFRIVNEETRQKVENPAVRAMREGLVVGLANHSVLIAKDGSERPIADSGAPIRGEKGEITGVVLVFRDQTQERASQKALAESERKFRETIAHLDEGYYSCTANGLLLEHNLAFNRILGFDLAQDLKGSKMPDFWQNPDERREYLKELMTRGSIRNYLIKAKKKSGEKIVVMTNSHLVKGEKDEMARIDGTFTDFSERVRMEEQLGERIKELQAFFSLSEIAEREGVTLENLYQELANILPISWKYAEIACARIVIGDSEFRTKNFAESTWMQSAPVKVNETAVGRIDVRYLEERPDQEEGPFLKEERRLIDAIAEHLGHITARKRAEDALRESESKFKRLYDSNIIGIIFWDTAGNIIQANGEFLRIVGYTEDDVLSGLARWKDMTPPEYAYLDEKAIKEMMEKGVSAPFEKEYIRKDGNRVPIRLNGAFLKGERDIGICFVQDITERKRSEEALREARDNLERRVMERTTELARSKQLLDETGKLARIGGWEFDLKKNTLSWTNMVYRIHEVGSEFKPTIDNAIKFYAPEAIPVISEAVRRAIEEGRPFDVELTLITAKKNRLWIRAIGEAYRENGRTVRIGGVFQDINERKLAEIEAREKSDKLQLLSNELEIIIDSIPGLVFYKDTNNRFIRVNKYMCDVYNMSKKQLEGTNLNELHSREQAQAYYEDDLQVIRSRQSKLNIDEPWETETGAKWVNTSKIPHLDETGEVVGVIGVSMDVTERKLAEEELNKYREHLEELVGERTAELAKSRELLVEAQTVARLGSWELDVVRDEITGSAEFYRLFGVGPENIAHYQQFIDLLHFDDRERVQRTVAEAFDRNIPYDTDYRIPDPDGGWRSINARGRVFFDENGRPLRFVGTCMDITERKRSETELLIKDQVFEKSMVAQSITDEKASIIHANPEFLRMWGYEAKEQVVGNSVGSFLADPTEAVPIIEALTAQGSWEGEFLANRVDGKSFISRGFISSLRNARGEFIGYQSTNLDVTKEREAEAHLRKTTADLASSNKELEQFAYVASHDLQEPLRMVSSYTQLLAQRYEAQLDDKAKKYIHYAVDGAVRMQRLINDLLSYSRIGTRGKSLEPTDAHSCLGEALKNLQAAIEENQAMITNDDLPTVPADASQLVQVFQNLIANAIKFRREVSPRVHVSARDEGPEWVFSVSDNGIGIDPQYKDRLFVIFQRLHTREEYPGTGIGLVLCKKVVERHGGRIWFESEPGKGSTFFFTMRKL